MSAPPGAQAKRICPYAQTVSEKLAAEKLRELMPEALREASSVEEEARRLAAESAELDNLRSQADVIQARLDLAAQQWYGRQTPKPILDEMERDGIELERLRERIAVKEARALTGREADEALQLLLSDPEGTFDALSWAHQAWIYRLLMADVKMRPSGRGGSRRLEVTYYRNKISGSTGAPSDRRMPTGSADFEAGKTCRTAACHRSPGS